MRLYSLFRINVFWKSLFSFSVALVGLTGCSSADASNVSNHAAATESDENSLHGSRDWLTVEPTFKDDSIVVEKVSYRSGAYRIYGQVCRPAADGRYPLVVLNHGGFQGLGDEWTNDNGSCRQMARSGYVTVLPSYRGEDGSDGAIEICLGEVDDVLTMIEVARSQPYVDRDRAGMLGLSVGGCIALRAVQRGAPVQVLFEFAGPTDWVSLHDRWTADAQTAPPELAGAYKGLLDQVHTSMGGTPAERPDEYRRRSPLAFVPELQFRSNALFMFQGNDDFVVPPDQTCRLATALSGVNAYHLDAQRNATTSNPSACEGAKIDWLAGPPPSATWPDPRYLVFYDGLGHADPSPAFQAAYTDLWRILKIKFPPK